jgi:hypothetical protein
MRPAKRLQADRGKLRQCREEQTTGPGPGGSLEAVTIHKYVRGINSLFDHFHFPVPQKKFPAPLRRELCCKPLTPLND